MVDALALDGLSHVEKLLVAEFVEEIAHAETMLRDGLKVAGTDGERAEALRRRVITAAAEGRLPGVEHIY